MRWLLLFPLFLYPNVCHGQVLPPPKPVPFEEFSLAMPTFDELFRPETEAQVKARLKAAGEAAKVKVGFPPEVQVGFVVEDPYAATPPMALFYPGYSVYIRGRILRCRFIENRREAILGAAGPVGPGAGLGTPQGAGSSGSQGAAGQGAPGTR